MATPQDTDGIPTGHLRASLAVGRSGYSFGCRCAGCRVGHAAYHRARRAAARAKRRAEPAEEKIYVVRADLDPNLPRLSLEYVAGFFDGEGCVNITGGRKKRCAGFRVHLRVMITNTDKDILDLIQANFGGRLTKPRREGWRGGNWKANRALNFLSGEAVAFLKKIRPHLKIKAPQADLAFQFWDYTHQPQELRFDQVLVPNPSPRFHGGQVCRMARKPEVVEKELWFKEQMHALNKKGVR